VRSRGAPTVGRVLALAVASSFVALVGGCSSDRGGAAGPADVDQAKVVAFEEARAGLRPENRRFLHAPTPEGSAEHEPAGGVGLDGNEVRDRLALVDPDDTLGMAWLAGPAGAGRRLVFESTGDAAQRRRLQAAAGSIARDKIRIIPGRHSWTRLQAYQDAVMAATGERSCSAGFTVTRPVTFRSHAVLLVMCPAKTIDDALVTALRAAAPDEVLRLQVGEQKLL
jgi:hypothetical protein